MSQPVKLSDGLVLDARVAGESVARSIAGQVEFWARLGRSVELVINGQQAMALSRKGATQPLSRLLETVDSPEGRRRVTSYLEKQPYPHFRPALGKPGMLERTDADGGITIGRFVNRRFRAIGKRKKAASSQ